MKTFTSTLDTEATVEALKKGIEAQNMRIVAHINGQANAAKIGKEVPADQILEVFRPDFAVRVWAACKPAGYDIPLRIYIYEDGDAVTVSCRLPTTVFAPYQSAELMKVGEELDGIFNGILGNVPEA